MPDPNAQTPTADELLTPGINKLVALRPAALKHINDGKGAYAKVFAGWRAQAALMTQRLADYALNGRLEFATGEPLKTLVASEFDTIADLDPVAAIGSVTMTRAASRPGGTIRKGSRFARQADTSSQALFVDATYTAAVDVPVAQGATSVIVPLIASRPGSFANRVQTGTAATELEIADEIVDRTSWTVTSYEVAGGSDGVSDDDLKHYARAYARGQYGPIAQAAVAGAFKAGGKRVIAVDDVSVAALRVFVADASWAGASSWASLIRQSLYDNKLVGFGCKVLVTPVVNTLVTIEATCKVRDPSYLFDTTGIQASIQKTLRSYLDDRADWNRWTLRALRGATARADRRLLSCSSIVVKDLAGNVISEPATSTATHYYLLDNGVSVTLQNPS